MKHIAIVVVLVGVISCTKSGDQFLGSWKCKSVQSLEISRNGDSFLANADGENLPMTFENDVLKGGLSATIAYVEKSKSLAISFPFGTDECKRP